MLVWSVRPGGIAGLLAAPLLLVCPGYALNCALRTAGRTDSLEVAVRTVALSFASAALGGLVLNAIGVSLNARSWATAMFIITIAAGYVGIRRSETTQPQESAVAPVASTAVLGLAIIALLTAAAVVAYASEHARDTRQSTTELSAMVDPENPQSLQILIGNSEAAAARYRVLIKGVKSRIEIPVALRAGQSRTLVVRRAHWAPRRPVTVQLIRTVEPGKVYRSVTIR